MNFNYFENNNNCGNYYKKDNCNDYYKKDNCNNYYKEDNCNNYYKEDNWKNNHKDNCRDNWIDNCKDDCRDKCKDDYRDNCRDNCKKTLEKYHELIKKANALYDEANLIVDKEVAHEICDALQALVKAFKINEKAAKLEMAANDFIDKTNCDKSSEKCKKALCEANEFYEKENKSLLKVGDLLQCALEEIEKSIKFRKCADKLFDNYVDCVHKNINKKDCNCR